MKRYDDIEKLALSIIDKYKTRNPLQILKHRNVHVMPFKGQTKLLGMYAILEDTRFVFYNPDISEEMQTMVFAHELGHDILHQDEARRQEIYEFELFNIETKMETEANLFASHLLIDDKDVEELADLNYTYDQIASTLNVNVNLILFKISEINRKYKKFNLDQVANNRFLESDY